MLWDGRRGPGIGALLASGALLSCAVATYRYEAFSAISRAVSRTVPRSSSLRVHEPVPYVAYLGAAPADTDAPVPPRLQAIVGRRGSGEALVWRVVCTGAGALSEPRIAAAPGGPVVLALTFQGAVDCGTGRILAAGGPDDFDGLVLQIDAAGRVEWIRAVSDIGIQAVASVALDSWGSVLVAGSFEGTIDLGGAPLTAETERDVLFAKLDAGGELVWQRRFGLASKSFGVDVDVAPSGRIFLLTRGSSSIDFGTGELSAKAASAFVSAFDLHGNALWSRAFHGSGEVVPARVHAARQNRAIVTGTFTGSADFGAGPITTAGRADGFAVQLDPSGSPLWSARFGDPALFSAELADAWSSGPVASYGAGDD